MNNSPILPISSSDSSQTINPFAQALERARGGQTSDAQSNQTDGLDSGLNSMDGNGSLQQRQAELLRRKQQFHRRSLEVNPVESQAVFDAKQKQVEQEILNLRASVQAQFHQAGQAVVQANTQVELTLQTKISKPGFTGAYFLQYFEKIQKFVRLRQKSANDGGAWATALHGKKRGKSSAPGIEYTGSKSVFDLVHHEVSQNGNVG